MRFLIIRIHGYQSIDELMSNFDLSIAERGIPSVTGFVVTLKCSSKGTPQIPFKLVGNDFEIQIASEKAYTGSDVDVNLLLLKKCGFKLNYEDIHALEASPDGCFTFVR